MVVDDDDDDDDQLAVFCTLYFIVPDFCKFNAFSVVNNDNHTHTKNERGHCTVPR